MGENKEILSLMNSNRNAPKKNELSINKYSRVPKIIQFLLIAVFAILWAIWMQPHTIGLRHFLLSIGSLMGTYVIIKNYRLFCTKGAVPIYLIALLFLWISFHLVFLSHSYELQLEEYTTIWKRVLWSLPFAIGLGIVGGQLEGKGNGEVNHRGAQISADFYWGVFYLGLITPTCIYLIRYIFTYLSISYGVTFPGYLLILQPPSTWYVAKAAYMFFCLPALALACSQLVNGLRASSHLQFRVLVIYVFTVLGVLAVFYLENIKNGIVYGVFLLAIALIKIALERKSQFNLKITLVFILIVSGLSLLVFQHVQKNDSWRTLLADIKVAREIDAIDAWKYSGIVAYPLNELGREVSGTNYLRAAWARAALSLIGDMPQGYGLVYESFRHIGKEKWPNSRLLQSHSGWLDLTLGIGLPGVFLIILTGILALRNLWVNGFKVWRLRALWLMLSITLLMITTETSQEIFLSALLFLILWLCGMSLGRKKDRN